jgi:hypothetical protein
LRLDKGIGTVKPFPTKSLNFEEAYAIGYQLWEFGKVLQDEPKYAKPRNWFLTYRYAIRGMIARIVTVDRDYQNLNTQGCGMAPSEEMTTTKARYEWNIVWESYAGVLFFAMDSSLECFTYALNALGYLLRPGDFIDITNDEKLKQITPANLLDPPKVKAVHSACLQLFPRICSHWATNRDLLSQIIGYHDATKHRHSVAVGQDPKRHLLKTVPKQAMGNIVFKDSAAVAQGKARIPHDEENSLQSIAASYRMFIIEWLRVARQDLEVAFGQPLQAPSC